MYQTSRPTDSNSLFACVAGVWHLFQQSRWWPGYVCLSGSGRLGPHVWPPSPRTQHYYLWGPPAPPTAPALLEQAGPKLPSHHGDGQHGGQCCSFCEYMLWSWSLETSVNDIHMLPMNSTFFSSYLQVVILDVRVPCTPVARLNNHRACVNGIAWAPHSSCHICTSGMQLLLETQSGIFTWGHLSGSMFSA